MPKKIKFIDCQMKNTTIKKAREEILQLLDVAEILGRRSIDARLVIMNEPKPPEGQTTIFDHLERD